VPSRGPRRSPRRDFDIRWFTPAAEIDLAGHPTLATAFTIFHWLEPGRTSVTFHSKSGPLVVERGGDLLSMEFPSRPGGACEPPRAAGALGARRARCSCRATARGLRQRGRGARARADFGRVAALGMHAVCVTAPGRDCDFVSRFFAPLLGINEDPSPARCTAP